MEHHRSGFYWRNPGKATLWPSASWSVRWGPCWLLVQGIALHASASTGGNEFTLSQRHRPPFHWESISPLANIWKILGQRSFINSFNISWNLLCPRSFSSPGQIGGTSSDAYIPGLHPEATKSSFVLVPLKTRFPAGWVGTSGQSTDGPKEAGASNFSLDLLPGCLVPLVGDILIRN